VAVAILGSECLVETRTAGPDVSTEKRTEGTLGAEVDDICFQNKGPCTADKASRRSTKLCTLSEVNTLKQHRNRLRLTPRLANLAITAGNSACTGLHGRMSHSFSLWTCGDHRQTQQEA
jgi:hypothetical protein